MLKLIKEAEIYAPEYIGRKDILIIGDKIGAIKDSIKTTSYEDIDCMVIDGSNKLIVPGFIDTHVHIIGGGGEGGYKTRTPEISLSEITTGGITTVVGCLGTDGVTRSMEALLAKARGLEEEGITTYIYTGSYHVPVATITGNIMRDIIIVDKIIGVGEIAITDHRSSQPTTDALKQLAAEARVGGILSGKAGVVNFHVGDGKEMLSKLFDIVENTEIPFTQFLPTHMNRSVELFKEAIRYAKAGGYIDFTTSSDSAHKEESELSASKALRKCLEEGVEGSRITFTSDGQGSLPIFNEKKQFIGLGIGRVTSLFDEVRRAILNEKVPFEAALKTITSNPADILKLGGKGRIQVGYDADINLLDREGLEIDTVIARGQIMIQNKEIKVFGTFEQNK